MVFNKTDRAHRRHCRTLSGNHQPSVAISAKTKDGFDRFLAELGQQLRPIRSHIKLQIPIAETETMARLYEVGQVEERVYKRRTPFSRRIRPIVSTTSKPTSWKVKQLIECLREG